MFPDPVAGRHNVPREHVGVHSALGPAGGDGSVRAGVQLQCVGAWVRREAAEQRALYGRNWIQEIAPTFSASQPRTQRTDPSSVQREGKKSGWVCIATGGRGIRETVVFERE